MEIKDIDKYFSFEILRRGYDYYKKGKVKEIIKAQNNFIAKVDGSESYTVTINLHKPDYKIKCTCPYAEEFNCKHMAAVLYCLKNDNIPIKINNINIETEEITNFQRFKKSFTKEYNKLFYNRNHIYENELEDYIDLIHNFIKETTKYIHSNKELAYDIFEYLLMDVDNLSVHDVYGEKENLFSDLFETFQELFEDKKIFGKLLAFILTIYTVESDEFYFEHKENMINLLYQYVKYNWQAEDALIILRKIEKNKDIYDFRKREIRIKIIYLNYYFIDKEEALCLAEHSLDLNEICEFLLHINKYDETKLIELLHKMIVANKGYSNKIYYEQLLSVYKINDKEKYLKLLKEYFIEHKNIEIYHEIKNNYNKEEWNKIKKEYLNMVKKNNIYKDICIEEGYYDELIESLEDEWIETINKYKNILIEHRPGQILDLYKNKVMIEIESSSCRQHYQKILNYFYSILEMPNGKEELNKIIKHTKENYKNRKALQEELEFFEETYM